MQVALERLPSFPFARLSAVRTFLYPQGSTDTFTFPLSEVCIPVNGVYTMFESHLQVS